MIVVVGAGPGGIAAALRAQECGVRVTVIDDNPSAGGQIWRGDAGNSWVQRFRTSGIPLLASTRVISIDAAAHTLLVETEGVAHQIPYSKLVLATGSRELFLPFPGWTLPGVFGAGGLQALAKSGLSVAGKRIVVGGTGPLLLAVGAYLRQHGADVKLIAEQANITSLALFAPELLRHPRKVLQGASLQWAITGVPYRPGCWIESAQGQGRLESVTVRFGRETWVEDCDYAAIGYGLAPNNELELSLGPNPPDIYVAETGEMELSFAEGEIAGLSAAGFPERAALLAPKREKARGFAAALATTFALREELKHLSQPETIVCRCEDVAFRRLQGFQTFRDAKLQTRCGMGPCQGRVCGPAGEFLFGWESASIRPPVFPALISSLLPDTKEP
jgi:NADPH-dependent 2,4-dienoyl-CoA reductase/sulfur reductase-like enzyme